MKVSGSLRIIYILYTRVHIIYCRQKGIQKADVELGTQWETFKDSERDAELPLPGMAPDPHGRLKKN